MGNEVNLTATAFNILSLLGQKNELARYKGVNGEYVSISTPIWINLGVYAGF